MGPKERKNVSSSSTEQYFARQKAFKDSNQTSKEELPLNDHRLNRFMQWLAWKLRMWKMFHHKSLGGARL